MKNLLFIALATFFTNISQAKDIREIWLSMPDSLISYLDKSKRIEMVDYIDMKVKADVKNALEGTSVMDTLTNEFLQVTLNEACTLQMRTSVFKTKSNNIAAAMPIPTAHVATCRNLGLSLVSITSRSNFAHSLSTSGIPILLSISSLFILATLR